MSGLVQCLELDGGEPAEGVLSSAAVVGLLDPGRRSPAGARSRVVQRRRFRTFFCSRLKKDSIAALSAQAPTRPIEPRSWRVAQGPDVGVGAELAAAVGVHDRVPAGPRRAMALRSASTASCGGHPGVDGVADDPLGAGVLDRAEVELALGGGVLGDVGQPQQVRRRRR